MSEVMEPLREMPCPRCVGCGKLADSEDNEAWVYWIPPYLNPPENLAVVMGIVKPIDCHDCAGTGKIEVPEIKR